MARARQIPVDYPAFAALATRRVTVGRGDVQLAVHIAGQLASDRLPIVCLAGYQRNMADFTELAALLPAFAGGHWPVVLIDLRGRGRSPDRARAADYGTLADAEDVSEVTRALGLEAAIFLGEGHGGQVIMALAAQRPTLVGGAVLVNSGPATVAQSLVRLRGNLESIAALRGKAGITAMLRRMLSAEYPGAPVEALDRLAGRTHYIDGRGRSWPLFDAALLDRFADLGFDDVLTPQWLLFDALKPAPLLLFRTEHTDQLPRDVLDEMMRRRPDARTLEIAGQGGPALLDQPEELRVIAEFLTTHGRLRSRALRQA